MADRALTHAEIDEKVRRFTAHADRLLDSGQMSYRDYKLALDDLRLWAQQKSWFLEPRRKADG